MILVRDCKCSLASLYCRQVWLYIVTHPFPMNFAQWPDLLSIYLYIIYIYDICYNICSRFEFACFYFLVNAKVQKRSCVAAAKLASRSCSLKTFAACVWWGEKHWLVIWCNLVVLVLFSSRFQQSLFHVPLFIWALALSSGVWRPFADYEAQTLKPCSLKVRPPV